jgi:hypothetical protein
MVPNRNLATFLVAVLSLVFASSAVAADNAAPPARTQIKLLTPFGVRGLSDGLTVAEKVNGKCFADSGASPTRPDAWRCSAGNAILDPCYQDILGAGKELACAVEGPWSQRVILLTLTEPLPTGSRKEITRKASLPWAIELANGKHCALFTGAMPPVAGMRINYGCPGGYQVVGDIDRSGPAWRVFFQGEQASALEQVEVTVAWY